MTTIRNHNQAIYNIVEWISQSDDPYFINGQEDRIRWHQAEIERHRASNKGRDKRRRTGPNWQVMIDRVQAKIDRKEQTINYYLDEIEKGHNPHYYKTMMEIAEFDLRVLRAEKKALLEKAKDNGYAAE